MKTWRLLVAEAALASQELQKPTQLHSICAEIKEIPAYIGGTEMVCFSCGTENPERNRFCGNCGAPLDAALQGIQQFLRRELADQIAVATTGWKDQKVLDVETTEAIVNRVQGWAKLFGFFVAIPLILLGVWLGLLGYNSFTAFQASVAKGKEEIDNKLSGARASVDDLQKKANALTDVQASITKKQADIGPKLHEAEQSVATLKKVEEDVGTLQNRAIELSRLFPEVQSLTNRVNDLQNQLVKFQASKELTPDRVHRIQETIAAFRSYLAALGIKPPQVIPTIQVAADGQGTLLSPTPNVLSISPGDLDDPFKYLWAYAETALEATRSGDSGLRALVRDYFCASFLERPSPIQTKTGGTYDWVAVFWRIRLAIGKESADRLLATAFKTAGNEGVEGTDNHIAEVLSRNADAFEGGTHSAAIKAVLATASQYKLK